MFDPSESPDPPPFVSDSIHPDLLRRAAEFMAHAREVQRADGRRFVGGAHLSDDILAHLFEAWDGSRLLAELRGHDRPVLTAEDQGVLFERFEEMCRRRRVPLPEDLRPAVYRLLALEAAVNASVFDAEPRHVVSATVLHGSLDHLPERFPEFADTPGLFRLAVRYNPSDPEGMLTRTREIEARLAADGRFADFRDTPGLFREAATGYPSDPEGYLVRIRSAIDRIMADDRFADFHDTPGVICHVASFHLSNPEGMLMRIRETAARLAADERFADFRDIPSLFHKAAINNPRDPEGYLERLRTTTARLQTDDRFADFRGTPGLFRRAATSYSSDPEGFLTRELARRQASEPRGEGPDDEHGR